MDISPAQILSLYKGNVTLIWHHCVALAIPLKEEVVPGVTAIFGGNTVGRCQYIITIHGEVTFLSICLLIVIEHIVIGVPDLRQNRAKYTGRIIVELTLKLRVSALSAGR